MSHTFYNSLDSACKSPLGAIPAGQAVTFNLTVPENLGYVDPHLVLTKDHEDPVHYRMEFTGQTPQVNHFTLTVAPTTAGRSSAASAERVMESSGIGRFPFLRFARDGGGEKLVDARVRAV